MRRSSVMASSRPVNDTGWKLRNGIFLGLSRAKRTTAPTCSLFTPLISVITGTMSTPALYRFSIARNFTSNRLPTALGEFDSIGRRLHALIAELTAVANRVEEVRGKRRLAAGELHRQLAARLDRD